MRRALPPLAFAVVFLALDAVWLTVSGPRLYRPALGPILAQTPRLVPAALFYLLYLAAAWRLAVAEARSPRSAALRAGLFGLAAYATYDLTNEATLAVWPVRLTLLDLSWGTGLTALAAYVAARVRARGIRA